MLRILVALDGSEHSEQALLHATAIAQAFEAEMVLVRVVATAENGMRSAIDPLDWQLHRHQVRAYLERRTEDLVNAGFTASWVLEEGRVAERLICCAERIAADLIIMGAVGRSGIGPFARGGTTQKVISAASTSVLIAPPGQTIGQVDRVLYKRILVPVDGSCGSQWALKIAAGIAAVHHAEMLLVQAIEKPAMLNRIGDSRHARELQNEIIRTNRQEAERNLSSLKARLPPGLPARSLCVVTQNVADAINDIAESNDTSLVVLSAHSDEHLSSRHFGPLAEFLLSHTHRAILVFHHSADQAVSNFRSTYLAETQANAG